MSDGLTGGAARLAYGALGLLLSPLAAPILRRRLRQGKEDTDRWPEKLGQTTAERPEGRLAWCHAVGLGEALALRALIAPMSEVAPDLSFLITSTSRTSAKALEGQLPPKCIHQFLPLDLPGPRRRFLDHWKPDLSIWAEQDLWPGFVFGAHRRGIPLAMVNARMNAAAYARRRKARALFAACLARFELIDAQDAETAQNLAALGAHAPRVSGSLKPAAPPLADAPRQREEIRAAIGSRPVWLAAATHPEDESIALAAHAALCATRPDALLIVAPRYPERGPEVAARATSHSVARRALGDLPMPETSVYIADTIGEMGIWYRLADMALIGGTFSTIEGHNPWEAAALGTGILHGPRTGNFRTDFADLDAAGAATEIADAEDLLRALARDQSAARDAARVVASRRTAAIEALARNLVHLIKAKHG